MKDFIFHVGEYEIKRHGVSLFIWELGDDGGRTNIKPLEITTSDLSSIIEESERLQAYNNPLCSEVTHAHTDLNNARGKNDDDFNIYLSAYTDVAYRHRISSGCMLMH